MSDQDKMNLPEEDNTTAAEPADKAEDTVPEAEAASDTKPDEAAGHTKTEAGDQAAEKRGDYDYARSNLLTELYPDFVAPDVSMPQDPHREIEIIEEEIAQRRRSWFKAHMTMFYVIAGIVVVALIFLGIRWFNDSTNPMSRFVSSTSRNFGSSFNFDVTVEKDGIGVMRYDGVYASDPSAQTVSIVYDAEYTGYSYRNVIYTDKSSSMSYKGNYYNGQWTIDDCTDRVQDFFDFHNDYVRGSFDGGSFLRFTELTSKYSSVELERFVATLRDRLATNSAVSQVSTKHVDDATVYSFDISMEALFNLIQEDGASIFFRSTDFDAFRARCNANKEIIHDADLTMSFAVTSGYMSAFDIQLNVGGEEYAIFCTMNSFGKAKPDIPADFFEAAAIRSPEN